LYFQVLKEVPWDEGKREFRNDVFSILLTGKLTTITKFSPALLKSLYQVSVDHLQEYSDEEIEIDGLSYRRFPSPIDKGHPNVFFMYYIREATKWLKEPWNQNHTGFTYFMPHWFSGLEYLSWQEGNENLTPAWFFEFCTLIQHYIPEHLSNPAAQQKIEFVANFKRFVEEKGLIKPYLIEQWQQAALNTEQEWEKKIYPCDFHTDPEVWDSWYEGPFTPLVIRINEDSEGLHEKLIELFNKNNFGTVNDTHKKRRIELTHILTPEFINEFPNDVKTTGIKGDLTRVTLTPEYMGTPNVTFNLDIISIVDLPKLTAEAIPRLIILERSTDHYLPDLSRRYCAHRQFMIDEVKSETGYQLLRYFGYTYTAKAGLTIPPCPGTYSRYLRESAFAFFNVDYSPLKRSTSAFLLDAQDDYLYLD
jgi:hypothetical protein